MENRLMTSQVCSRYLPILSDGIPDNDLVGVYKQLEEEGSLRWLFFSNECRSPKHFLNIVRDPKNLFYVVVDLEKKDLVCVYWLNSRTDINCSIHISFFKKYFGKTVNISKYLLKQIFKELVTIESLLCFIPETNRLANSFVKKVGWTYAGSVPSLIRDITTLNIVTGNMYYILRKEVQHGR